MLQINFEHPLSYPSSHSLRPINMRGYDNNFTADMAVEDALTYLEQELSELKSTECSVITNFRHIGNPRLREQLDRDTGAMVEFAYQGHKYRIICDRWSLIAHNIYTLHLPLRHARNFDKWGIGSTADALIAFAAGTQTASTHDESAFKPSAHGDWMSELGLGPTATLDDANAVYRYRAKKVGDDEEALMHLNKAIESARKALS